MNLSTNLRDLFNVNSGFITKPVAGLGDAPKYGDLAL